MKSWIYWLLGSACYFYQFVFRTIFSTLGNEIGEKFHISVIELSTFFSVTMMTYALMQIPGGILLDRYGPRRVLSLAMFILSISSICVGMTSSFTLALCGRALMGVGAAFAFAGTSKIVSMWFPLPMMGFLLGTTVFLGGMGGAFSNTIYAAIPGSLEPSLMFMGASGLVLVALVYGLLRERPQGPATQALKATPLPWYSGLKEVIHNRQILFSAMFMFFGYLPISILGDSWGPLAFEKIFATSAEIANKTVLYFYIAYAIGSLVYASVATMLNRPKEVLLFGYTTTIVFLYILLQHTDIGAAEYAGIPGFLILSSLIAFNVGGISLAFPIGCAHASPQIAATVVGVMNMLCMISGSVFSKLIGVLVEFYDQSAPAMASTGWSYTKALNPLMVTSVLAILFLLAVKEKKTLPTT